MPCAAEQDCAFASSYALRKGEAPKVDEGVGALCRLESDRILHASALLIFNSGSIPATGVRRAQRQKARS